MPVPATNTHISPASASVGRQAAFAGLWTLILLATIAPLSAAGGPHSLADGFFTVIVTLLTAGRAPALYLLGAFGLGRLLRPLTHGSRDPLALQFALGLSLMLTLSHALGCLGLLAGPIGRVIATAPCAVGLLLLAEQAFRAFRRAPTGSVPWSPDPSLLLWIPGLAVMLVAACNPPGWLWSSEFGGFDALSYHLQLPQEWLRAGRIAPLAHNVYSYLPGYVESAFYHLAVMTGSPATPTTSSRAVGLLAGDGDALLSCQLLSVGLAVLTAFLVTRLVRMVLSATTAPDSGTSDPTPSLLSSRLAGALVLCTPWVVVVGSLAYNDLGVTALFAAALIAALDRQATPARRGVTTGLLIGVACGCKPTALMLAVAPAAIILLGSAPRHHWTKLIATGAAAGLAAISPWVIRNIIYSGNPVFPLMAGWFGSAHWTMDQVARYRAEHFFQGPISERLRLSILPDLADPAGPRHRGLLHTQWFLFFPLAAGGALAATTWRIIQRPAMLLSLSLLAQLVLWLATTHIQSRFLLPLLVPGAALFGLGFASALTAANRRGRRTTLLTSLILAIPVLVQAAASVQLFLTQVHGQPNARLVMGPPASQALDDALASLPPAERNRLIADASPVAYCNQTIPDGATLYLLGDSTPLYFTCPILYHTTWDRSPLGDALRSHHNDAFAAAADLTARGVQFILYNRSELARLQHSGFYDPLVTPQSAEDFFALTATLVRAWPEAGTALYRLNPQTTTPASGSAIPSPPTNSSIFSAEPRR
jgi:hypothetical protein